MGNISKEIINELESQQKTTEEQIGHYLRSAQYYYGRFHSKFNSNKEGSLGEIKKAAQAVVDRINEHHSRRFAIRVVKNAEERQKKKK